MGEGALEVGGGRAWEGFFVDRRNAFVEDEEGILDERVRLEEAAQEPIEETVADCREYHTLVMTHEHIDGRSVSRAVKVDRFDITIDASTAVRGIGGEIVEDGARE